MDWILPLTYPSLDNSPHFDTPNRFTTPSPSEDVFLHTTYSRLSQILLITLRAGNSVVECRTAVPQDRFPEVTGSTPVRPYNFEHMC
jgi:hypothetical protein